MQLPMDKEKFAQWISEKWDGDVKCQVCAKNEWFIADHLVEVREFMEEGGESPPGKNIYPLILLICNNCGHTLPFNAYIVNRLNQDDREAPEAPPEE